jgi:PAS domain-containing protein
MPQQEIEVILMRQLASYLAMPILVVDPKGDLVFFNEAAEALVGRRFDETGTIRRGEWTATFKPTDEDGSPIKREDQLLFIATDKNQPVHRRFWIQGMDGIARKIEAVAFPLEGQSGRKLGAVMISWEIQQP